MKKLPIAVLLVIVAGLSFGKTIDDIDTTDSNLKSYFDFTTSANDTLSNISWRETMTWDSTSQRGNASAGHAPYSSDIRFNSSAFTISFDLFSLSTQNDKYLLSMTVANDASAAWKTFALKTDADSNLQMTFAGQNYDTELNSSELDATTLTIVGTTDSTKKATFTLYIDGIEATSFSQVGATNWSDGGNLKLQFGYYGNSANTATATFDNILLYDTALTAAQVKALVVPEPATAVLSLLGLGALAIRRRRA